MRGIGRAIELAHGLWDTIDGGGDAARRLIELERALMLVEQENTALLKEKDAFEQRIAEFEAFDVERERYKHHQLASTAWVVTVKPDRAGESDLAQEGMYFCEPCFAVRQRSILQPVHSRDRVGYALKCHRCDSVIEVEEPPRGAIDFC